MLKTMNFFVFAWSVSLASRLWALFLQKTLLKAAWRFMTNSQSVCCNERQYSNSEHVW